ncbi:2-oxoglutarate synthase subunit KorA [uncultured archaeon]|nr:2-oxoglutarate synthase subunit KorA [uncultured archaeon]
MDDKEINWMVGGEAGQGIMTSGAMFAKALMRGGYHVCDTVEYPSLVRGGNNTYTVRASTQKINSVRQNLDVLIALNKETIELNQQFVQQGGVIIWDGESKPLEESEKKQKGVEYISVPFAKITADVGGPAVTQNTVAVGASMAVIDYDLSLCEAILAETFGTKKKEVLDINIKAIRGGYDYVKQNYPHLKFSNKIKAGANPNRIIVAGNEACGLGAIKAGLKLYCAYPMTPSSSIMHYIATQEKPHNLVLKHAEDEIAAVIQAIGASYAGIRAATGTSGGGFALMTEAMGLAGITETPIVVFEVQRPGPATGLPTHTAQGDIRQVLHAGQDESPRVLLAPGDVTEAYEYAAEAFNIAEKYQIPVIVLSDKYLGESHFSAEPFSKIPYTVERGKIMSDEEAAKQTGDFARYKDAPDHISVRTLPGQKGGIHRVTSYEHDENTYPSENPTVRQHMMDKRMGKMDAIKKGVPKPKWHGPKDADVTLIVWGSVKGPVLDALPALKKQGITANVLQITTLWPFPIEEVKDAFKHIKKSIIIEQNYSSQLTGLMREEAGLTPEIKILKYDGRPLYPEEVVREVAAAIKSNEARRVVVTHVHPKEGDPHPAGVQ